MNKDYLITVIVPVYNLQDYIEECIESVVNQSIGISNIQLILVNDGSNDDSESICLKYSRLYPENVIYISQTNAGVSAARNRGIEEASGVLITFLDGDDKWSTDSFRTVYAAYTEHPDVSVFSCRMIFFDKASGEHQLNYKYETDAVRDIRKYRDCPQLSSSSVFIRRDVVERHRFDEDLKYSEDFRFINELLLDHPLMMVLESPVYWYRKRESNDSAMQTSLKSIEYYTFTCENVYRYLFDLSQLKYGHVLRYLQFCVMYDLRWRLKIPLNETGMNENEQSEYITMLKGLLNEIDEDIILDQKRIALALQLYAIEVKRGSSIEDSISVNDSGIIDFERRPIFDINKQAVLFISGIELNSDGIVITGEANLPFREDDFSLLYLLKRKTDNSRDNLYKSITLKQSGGNEKTYLHGVLKRNHAFEINEAFSLEKEAHLSFFIEFRGKRFPAKCKYLPPSGLSRKNSMLTNGYIHIRRDKNSLIMKKVGMITRLKNKIADYFFS